MSGAVLLLVLHGIAILLSKAENRVSDKFYEAVIEMYGRKIEQRGGKVSREIFS